MTESVKHADFRLERTYDTPLATTFAAWSTPSAKARWFAGPDAAHELDFRPGGRERVANRLDDGRAVVFESTYHDILDQRRIVYSSTLSTEGRLATVSITTVEFEADGDRTHLTLTEQDTYLDEQELPDWRRTGTATWLDALGVDLEDVNS
jgi:uncharacterized protein YndB with AHSA1/START domain